MAEDRLVAGFPQSAWDLFLAPLPLSSVIVTAPGVKGQYVKHQVLKEILNRAFGVDGWTSTVRWVREQPQYTDQYQAKDSTGKPVTGMEDGRPVFWEKLGRHYAVACVRLTIGRPGGPRVWREDCGSQVSAADWSEASKGAVSEALKRAAAQFGFASEVYMTEQLEQVLGEKWEEQILPTYTPPWTLPVEHSDIIIERMTALGWEQEKRDAELAAACKTELAARSLASNLASVLKARKDVREAMADTGAAAEDIEARVLQIVDLRTANDIARRTKEEAAAFIGGGTDGGSGHAGTRLQL